MNAEFETILNDIKVLRAKLAAAESRCMAEAVVKMHDVESWVRIHFEGHHLQPLQMQKAPPAITGEGTNKAQ